MGYRTVNVRPETYDRLRIYKGLGLTFDEVLNHILDRVDPASFHQELLAAMTSRTGHEVHGTGLEAPRMDSSGYATEVVSEGSRPAISTTPAGANSTPRPVQKEANSSSSGAGEDAEPATGSKSSQKSPATERFIHFRDRSGSRKRS